MIVKVHTGTSILGAADYHLNNKGVRAPEGELGSRVAWTHTLNSGHDDPWDTVRSMEETAHQNPLADKYCVTIMQSWGKDETPTREHMIESGKALLAAEGLSKHEALILCHIDEPQPHIHIIACRVHPTTLESHDLPYYKLTAQKWASDYEREHGIKCHQREENRKKRENGEYVKYTDNTLKEAWAQSDSGKAFKAMLEDRGWKLALDKRTTEGGRDKQTLMAVTPSGCAMAIMREINNDRAKGERLREKEFMARFADLDLSQLPSSGAADKAQKAIYMEEQTRKREAEKQAAQEARSQKKTGSREMDNVVEFEARAEEREIEERRVVEQSRLEALKQKAAAAEREKLKRHNAEKQEQAEVWYREDYAAEQDNKIQDEAIRLAEEKAANTAYQTQWAKLTDYYNLKALGGSLTVAQKQAAEIEHSLWAKITGKHRKACAESEALQKNLDNACWRQAEALSKLDIQYGYVPGGKTEPPPELRQTEDIRKSIQALKPDIGNAETLTLRSDLPKVSEDQPPDDLGEMREISDAPLSPDDDIGALREEYADMGANQNPEPPDMGGDFEKTQTIKSEPEQYQQKPNLEQS